MQQTIWQFDLKSKPYFPLQILPLYKYMIFINLIHLQWWKSKHLGSKYNMYIYKEFYRWYLENFHSKNQEFSQISYCGSVTIQFNGVVWWKFVILSLSPTYIWQVVHSYYDELILVWSEKLLSEFKKRDFCTFFRLAFGVWSLY